LYCLAKESDDDDDGGGDDENGRMGFFLELMSSTAGSSQGLDQIDTYFKFDLEDGNILTMMVVDGCSLFFFFPFVLFYFFNQRLASMINCSFYFLLFSFFPFPLHGTGGRERRRDFGILVCWSQ